MSFNPSGCRVLIKPDPEEEKEKGGLIIKPMTALDREKRERRYGTGIVVAMGPGMPMDNGGRWPMPDGSRPDILPDIHGKRVIYYKMAEQPYMLDGVEHVIVRDESIDGIVED